MVLEEAIRNGLILCEKGRELLSDTLSHFNKSTGYWYTRINKKRNTVHRHIAEALLPRPEGLDCINHLNGIKTDNRLENLKWCTQAQNMQHAYETGLMDMPPPKPGAEHYLSKPIVGIHLKTGERLEFESQGRAAVCGFNQGKISLSVNGKRRAHRGYQWFLADDPRLLNHIST